MFELLDEDHSGMISAKNLRSFMETTERVKRAGFDMGRYETELATNQELTLQFNIVENELEDLVAEFDLTGDRLISPEEFYNIIMALYD